MNWPSACRRSPPRAAGCRHSAPHGRKRSSRQPSAPDPSNAPNQRPPRALEPSKGKRSRAPELDLHMDGQPQEQPEKDARRAYLERERALAALATRQHGVVARSQLIELGLGRGAIDTRLRAGRLSSIHRGVYAVRGGAMGADATEVIAGGGDERQRPAGAPRDPPAPRAGERRRTGGSSRDSGHLGASHASRPGGDDGRGAAGASVPAPRKPSRHWAVANDYAGKTGAGVKRLVLFPRRRSRTATNCLRKKLSETPAPVFPGAGLS